MTDLRPLPSIPLGRYRHYKGLNYEVIGAGTADCVVGYAQAGRWLYAPGLRDIDTIRQVVAAVSKPLNVVMSPADPKLTVQQLEAAGVKRISVGGALSRLGFAAVRDAALAMRAGSFAWVAETMPGKDLKVIFK